MHKNSIFNHITFLIVRTDAGGTTDFTFRMSDNSPQQHPGMQNTITHAFTRRITYYAYGIVPAVRRSPHRQTYGGYGTIMLSNAISPTETVLWLIFTRIN